MQYAVVQNSEKHVNHNMGLEMFFMYLLGSNPVHDPYPRQESALLNSTSPGGLFGLVKGSTVAIVSISSYENSISLY